MKKLLLILTASLFAMSFLGTGCVIVDDDDGGYCGDGICQVSYEDEASCPEDCVGSDWTCGNGICEVYYGENDGNCSSDCNPATICSDTDYWLENCYPTCDVAWDCEGAYSSYAAADRDDLAYCATCLANDAESNVCDAGCVTSDNIACENFIDDLIGLDCWKK